MNYRQLKLTVGGKQRHTGAARQDIEARTGQPVARAENHKTLTARAQQPALPPSLRAGPP